MGQCAYGFIQHDATVVEDFLELCRSFAASMRSKVGFSSHIDRIEIGPVVKARRWQTKFIRGRGLQISKSLRRICMHKGQLCAKGCKVIELHERVFAECFVEIVHNSLRPVCVSRIR